MKIVQINECLGVSAQISADDVTAIAAAGYKVLINNRPEREEDGQPSGADIAAAAAAAGLEYHHMPVTAGDFPGADFNAMTELLDDSERPVLAFCRSGTRCANLWVASRASEEREAAAALAQQQGFDLGMAANYVTRL